MAKERVLTSFITRGSYQEFVKRILAISEEKKSSYVCFANVHMVVEAYKDPSFNKIINEADIVAPDGKPISVFLRLFKNIKQDRVCGMDILPDLLKEAEKSGKSVYFYGTTQDTLDAIAARSKREFPNLKTWFYSPPFRLLSDEEKHEIVNKVNIANPDLLFVALGCPKQEKWMAEHKGKVQACMLGLGQAFHVYAGKEKRLPKWMQNLSLEWVYRLVLEPRRLWKRYLVTNSLFLLFSFKEIFVNRNVR